MLYIQQLLRFTTYPLQQERRRSRLESDAKIVLEVGTMLSNPLLLRTSSLYGMRHNDVSEDDESGQ